MSIYTVNDKVLDFVYDMSGERLHYAYDKSGNEAYVSGDTFQIKVMAYNVGQWYTGGHDNIPVEYDDVYYDLQSGIISKNNADVLLLEEYTAQFSKAGRTSLSWLSPMYPYYHEQTNGTTTTVQQRAVYSKYPITNYVTHAYTDKSGYYFDECTITINSVPITFIVTHMHWNNRTYRAQEAQQIIASVSDKEFFVVGGDFNLTDFKDTEGQDYIRVVKPFVDAGYNIANGGNFGFLTTYSDSPDGTFEGCLDEIVTSSRISIDSVTVDETKLIDSLNDKIDHMPIIAVVSVPY